MKRGRHDPPRSEANRVKRQILLRRAASVGLESSRISDSLAHRQCVEPIIASIAHYSERYITV
jgi:hypothetical protein